MTVTGDGLWWRDAVLYENHLPSFRDGDGDGIGDLEGLIASLDYLGGTLGVTAVWVGPFFRSPLLDQGFDISRPLRRRAGVRQTSRPSTGCSRRRTRAASG